MERRNFEASDYRASNQKVVVVSGPSGTGKGTLIKRAVERAPDEIKLPASYTTRDPRPGEVDGVHYNFVNRDKFGRLLSAGLMIEWNEYSGNLYGSPSPELIRIGLAGQSATILYEIEVVGAQSLLDVCPESLWIGVLPPSNDELRRRLQSRGENLDSIGKRMRYWKNVERPVLERGEGRHKPNAIIVNRDLDLASREFCYVVENGEEGRLPVSE